MAGGTKHMKCPMYIFRSQSVQKKNYLQSKLFREQRKENLLRFVRSQHQDPAWSYAPWGSQRKT